MWCKIKHNNWLRITIKIEHLSDLQIRPMKINAEKNHNVSKINESTGINTYICMHNGSVSKMRRTSIKVYNKNKNTTKQEMKKRRAKETLVENVGIQRGHKHPTQF